MPSDPAYTDLTIPRNLHGHYRARANAYLETIIQDPFVYIFLAHENQSPVYEIISYRTAISLYAIDIGVDVANARAQLETYKANIDPGWRAWLMSTMGYGEKPRTEEKTDSR